MSIRIDQGDTGTAGQSRSDLAAGNFTATETTSGSSYQWYMAVSEGCTAVLSDATAQTCTVTGIADGDTVLLFSDVDGAASSYTTEHGGRSSTQGGAAVLNSGGFRRPALGERKQFGGWDAQLTALVDQFTTDTAKLAGIEAGAAADQTGAEIKTAYEAEADTNAFDDAALAKLSGIEAGATADQTGAEIKTAYEAEADTNAFTDAEKSSLAEAIVDSEFAGSATGSLQRTGPASYGVLAHNFAAAVAPAATDDSGDGYGVGSRWVDTVAGNTYECTDASVGAAVWVQTNGGGGGGDVTAAAAIAANRVVVGDDGAKGVKESLVEITTGGALMFDPTGARRNYIDYAAGDTVRIITQNSVALSLGSGFANFRRTPVPDPDGSKDLGATSLRWANLFQSGYHQFTEMTAPAGAGDAARLFARDNGAGKTQLCVVFGTGAVQVLATEP